MADRAALRRTIEAADLARRYKIPADWLAFVDAEGDALVAAMGAWLDGLSGLGWSPSALDTTRLIFTLWAQPGLCGRADVAALAARFITEGPARPSDDDAFAGDLVTAVGHLLRARAALPVPVLPDAALQAALWQAAEREAWSWGARLVYARFAFPLNAEALRARFGQATFTGDTAPLDHQSWLLCHGDHPEVPATWAAVFRAASFSQRRAMLAAAGEHPADAARVLRALVWLAPQRVLDPAPAVAALAARVGGRAGALALSWLLCEGPAEGNAACIEALRGAPEPAALQALHLAATEALDPAIRAAAAEALRHPTRALSPADALSDALQGELAQLRDPGGLSFTERQHMARGWAASFEREGAAPLTPAERAALLDLIGRCLADARDADRRPVDAEWISQGLAMLGQPTWGHDPGALTLLMAAVDQAGHPPSRAGALKALAQHAERGDLTLSDAHLTTLKRLPREALSTASQWRRALLRLPRHSKAFAKRASEHLGEAPPVGLQAYLLNHPATPNSLAGLGALYEACDEVQRRALLQALAPPIDPGYLPVLQAIALQGSPQVGGAALEALGRVGDRSALAWLHTVQASHPALAPAAEAAILALRAALPVPEGAAAGALAVAAADAGALALSIDGDAPRAATAPPPAAPDGIRLALTAAEGFTRLPAPPRRVPLSATLAYWTLGPGRSGVWWSLWLALSLTYAGLVPRVGTAWAIGLAIGGLGWLGMHWLGGTHAELRLLRHGRTAGATDGRHWTTSRRHKDGTDITYHYAHSFVAEDGRTYTLEQRSSSARPELVDDGVEGILYAVDGDGAVGLRRPIDSLRPVQVGPDGRLSTRLSWRVWTALAWAPWPYVAWVWLGRALAA